MDIFERLLKLFGRDYWSLSDRELWNLAKKYRLLPRDSFSLFRSKEPENEEVYFAEEVDMFDMLDPQKTKERKEKQLKTIDRAKIIDGLVYRDKFASAFFSVIISILALVVSILVAFFK